MRGVVDLDLEKLSPTYKAELEELKLPYEQGAEYWREGRNYLLWYIVFYAAAVGSLIADLELPTAFALVVAIYCIVQRMKCRSMATKIAHQIFHLEEEIFSQAMKEALRTFKEIMNNERAKPRVTRKRGSTDSNSNDSPSGIWLDKSGEIREADNPKWYNPKGKK